MASELMRKVQSAESSVREVAARLQASDPRRPCAVAALREIRALREMIETRQL